MNSPEAKEFSLKDHFYGAATVGERGQIVIPVEARKRYNIETGDKILIMGAPHERGLMLIKIEALREFMMTILADLQDVEREIAAGHLDPLGRDAESPAKTESVTKIEHLAKTEEAAS